MPKIAPICAFDFPLRYRLKDLCDTYGFSLRRLADGGTLMSERPDRAVTFVETGPLQGDPDLLTLWAEVVTCRQLDRQADELQSWISRRRRFD